MFSDFGLVAWEISVLFNFKLKSGDDSQQAYYSYRILVESTIDRKPVPKGRY